jgi:hypothetical protein
MGFRDSALELCPEGKIADIGVSGIFFLLWLLNFFFARNCDDLMTITTLDLFLHDFRC